MNRSRVGALALITWLAATAAARSAGPPVVSGPAAPRSVEIDLRRLPRIQPEPPGVLRVVPRRRPNVQLPRRSRPPVPDPVVQRRQPLVAEVPVEVRSFEGMSTMGVMPPDTIGDVGPDHFVQMVNLAFTIYDKSGTVLAGPLALSTLWTALGSPCTTNRGDPVVLYDGLADRWLLSQFAQPASECVAISKGPDPVSDGYWVYEFVLANFPDYPKFGVWPDAYYMGSNSDPNVFALDRVQMLAGLPATVQQFTVATIGFHSMLMPADLDGKTPPPAGAPGYFYRHVDDASDESGGVDRLELFELQVDFAVPANSILSEPVLLPTAPFESLCGFSFDCVAQPDTAQRLDSVTEWPMWRFAYRNFGGHEALVANHAVDVGGSQAGIRWYELRKSGGGSWTIHQQSTFAPDETSRFMGSVAMDRLGDIALGYSASSSAVYPSLRFTGRLASDAPDTMTLGESVAVAGGGSQTGSNRWGDYSSLGIDPEDDCTFWYTGEYYATTSPAGWQTYVVAFQLPACVESVFGDGFEAGDPTRWSATKPSFSP